MHMFLSFLTTVIQNFSCQVWWQYSHIGSLCSRLKIIPCLLSEAPVIDKKKNQDHFFLSKSLPIYNYDVFPYKHPLSYRSLYFSNDKRWSSSKIKGISNTTKHAQQCFQGENGEETSATRLCILRGTVVSNAETSIILRRLKELHIWRFRGSIKNRSSYFSVSLNTTGYGPVLDWSHQQNSTVGIEVSYFSVTNETELLCSQRVL